MTDIENSYSLDYNNPESSPLQPKITPLSIDHPDFKLLQRTLTCYGLWRPRLRREFLVWQCIVFCLVGFFLMGFILSFMWANQLNDTFSVFPFRFTKDWGTFFSALCLNTFPTACFCFVFAYLNHHLQLRKMIGNSVSQVDTQLHFSKNLTGLRSLSQLSYKQYHQYMKQRHIILLLFQLLAATLVTVTESVNREFFDFFRFLYWVWLVIWLSPVTCFVLITSYTLQVHIFELIELKNTMESKEISLLDVKDRIHCVVSSVNATAKEFQWMIVANSLLLLGAIAGMMSEIFIFKEGENLSSFLGGHYVWEVVALVAFFAQLILIVYEAAQITSLTDSLSTNINELLSRQDEQNQVLSLLACRLEHYLPKQGFKVFGVAINMKTFFSMFGVLGTFSILAFQQIVKQN